MPTSEIHGRGFVCPACGADLLVPERDDLGFACEVCGVHLVRREGHIHLEWNHRDMPGPGPHERPHRFMEEHPVQVR